MQHTRNQICLATIWPSLGVNPDKVSISIIDQNGEVRGEYKLNEPVLGSSLARLVPDGWFVEFHGCQAHHTRGEAFITTALPFDTTVVTERQPVTFEQRFELLERRAKNQEKAAQMSAAREKAFRQEIADLRQAQLVEDDPITPETSVEETTDET